MYLLAMQSQFIDVLYHHQRTMAEPERIRMQLWDTSGSERFRQRPEVVTRSYIRGAHGILVAFDVTCTHGLEDAEEFLKRVVQYNDERAPNTDGAGAGATHGVVHTRSMAHARALGVAQRMVPTRQAIVLVGMKIDLVHKRVITRQQGLALAARYGVSYSECSSKTGKGMDRTGSLLLHHCRANWRSPEALRILAERKAAKLRTGPADHKPRLLQAPSRCVVQ